MKHIIWRFVFSNRFYIKSCPPKVHKHLESMWFLSFFFKSDVLRLRYFCSSYSHVYLICTNVKTVIENRISDHKKKNTKDIYALMLSKYIFKIFNHI